MMRFITDNLSTILLSLGLAALVASIVRRMARDRRSGVSQCASCAGCPSAASCAQQPAGADTPPA
ncbi:MAG TPA: FeoB-associated Cys-rich membrane protein [Candidatus Limnocylindria bacterium]|nr:FeoB-associated Cys-rich membrane protein [Candidatus Limnocylindria bacterium]